jgi:HPr kinase/phosphorylase
MNKDRNQEEIEKFYSDEKVKTINVKDFIKECQLEQINCFDLEKISLFTSECVRPSFELAGYFEYFDPNRIQVFGSANCAFLQSLHMDIRKQRLKQLLDYNIPAIIVGSSKELPKYAILYANERNIPIFYSSSKTSEVINIATNYLIEQMAEKITKHGVLVEVYGIGVLILGKSGIGKSECALELVKRGHRLVVDDVVTIRKISSTSLIGFPDDLIKHHMEIRGLGIIDIKELFGISAIAEKKKIELVISFEELETKKEYDRLGLEEQYELVLGIKIPKITIPVTYGKNLSIIVEVSSMHHHLKMLGHNPAKEFMDKLLEKINKVSNINDLLK